jgi:uncharacterized phage protein (TIGR02218 family)
MKSLTSELIAHYALGTTTLTTCWRATLTNGTVVAATALDRDLVIGGVTYLSASGYSAKDVSSSLELNPDSLEIEGFLASPAITDADIHSGIWDYAAIEIFEVNYNDLTMGKNILRAGTLGEVKGGRSRFTAELRGLMQAFTKTIVGLTTKECTADLGDDRCKVNLASYTVTGTVEGVTNNRIIADSFRHEEAGWFTAAKLTFTSGANEGLSMEVKTFVEGLITLQQAMPFDIAEGDEYSVHVGCQKRFTEDCGTKFNNKINFRGFPNVPGASIYKRGGQ